MYTIPNGVLSIRPTDPHDGVMERGYFQPLSQKKYGRRVWGTNSPVHNGKKNTNAAHEIVMNATTNPLAELC